ncbi:MAG TPA: DUF4350 domain-containing protein [Thermoanaerobaculia bacterium]|nr:DUF4350 domain-containing protein [Thermoanaerobaculia bacterium]
MTEPLLDADAETLAGELEGGFSRRTLAWSVGIAVGSFAIFLLLLAFGRDLERRPAPGANTFSHSALGYRAAAELLRAMGLGVVSRQATAGSGVGPDHPLVVAEPDPGQGASLSRLAALYGEARDREAPLVVVLPKWSPLGPRKDKPEWLADAELMPAAEVEWTLRGLKDPDLVMEPLRLRSAKGCRASWSGGGAAALDLVVESPVQLLPAEAGLEPVIQCAGGYLVARRPAKPSQPQVVVVADPDVLNNQGIGRGENAKLIYQLFTRTLGAKGAVFDETIHGFNQTRGLLAEALRFPMVLAVLQGLVLLGVVLWTGMGRFGKPLPAPPGLAAGKEILIGNTAELLAGGGHAGDSASRYFQQTTRAVAAHYFVPPDLPEADRLARLQRLSERHGKTLNLAALESDLRNLPAGRRGQENAVWIAQRLYHWRLEMTNVDRKST